MLWRHNLPTCLLEYSRITLFNQFVAMSLCGSLFVRYLYALVTLRKALFGHRCWHRQVGWIFWYIPGVVYHKSKYVLLSPGSYSLWFWADLGLSSNQLIRFTDFWCICLYVGRDIFGVWWPEYFADSASGRVILFMNN